MAMSDLRDKPSKKDFADLINQVTGEETMTEKKLDQILRGANKSLQDRGTEGFFDYLRQVVQVPVPDEWMEKTWKDMQTVKGARKTLEQLQIPIDSWLLPAEDTETQAKKRKKK
jgi:hypothetical protein